MLCKQIVRFQSNFHWKAIRLYLCNHDDKIATPYDSRLFLSGAQEYSFSNVLLRQIALCNVFMKHFITCNILLKVHYEDHNILNILYIDISGVK